MKKHIPVEPENPRSQQPIVGFIGGGNMARSLIGGLIQDGYPAAAIQVCDPDPAQRERLLQQFNIKAEIAAAAIVDRCECLMLAVKPQTMRAVIAAVR
jgi:pyrroline-5-carboxylate reductase